jgi:1-deoxy-D-xylulose-5-phosphate synthase
MAVACPSDEAECRQLLCTAFAQDHPVAVRYPRGAGVGAVPASGLDGLPLGKGEWVLRGQGVAILAFGTLLHPALAAAKSMRASVANMRWAKPLDLDLLRELAGSHQALVTLEEGCVMGGAGSAVLEALHAEGLTLPVLQLGLPDKFVEHGDHGKLLAMEGLDAQGIERAVRARFSSFIGSSGTELKNAA